MISSDLRIIALYCAQLPMAVSMFRHITCGQVLAFSCHGWYDQRVDFLDLVLSIYRDSLSLNLGLVKEKLSLLFIFYGVRLLSDVIVIMIIISGLYLMLRGWVAIT